MPWPLRASSDTYTYVRSFPSGVTGLILCMCIVLWFSTILLGQSERKLEFMCVRVSSEGLGNWEWAGWLRKAPYLVNTRTHTHPQNPPVVRSSIVMNNSRGQFHSAMLSMHITSVAGISERQVCKDNLIKAV